MAGWVFDADITKPAVGKFSAIGVVGKHIQDDLEITIKEDRDVLQYAKQIKSTLVTANYKDFADIKLSELNNTYGVWVFNTKDPNEQARLMKATLKVTKMRNLATRHEKKVYIKGESVEVTDVRSQKKSVDSLPKKGIYKKKG